MGHKDRNNNLLKIKYEQNLSDPSGNREANMDRSFLQIFVNAREERVSEQKVEI
jgi:hypothetical protein